MIDHGIGDLQEVSARALTAGTDMDMVADGFIGTLEKSLKEGKVTEATLTKPADASWRPNTSWDCLPIRTNTVT